MRVKEIIYCCFYSIFFALSIWTGVKTGFTGNSHTPPGPYLIEFFILPTGIVLLLIDITKYKPATFKKIRIHVFGLFANGCIMAYVLILALN